MSLRLMAMGSFICCPKDLGTQEGMVAGEVLAGVEPRKEWCRRRFWQGFGEQNTKAHDGSWKIFRKRKYNSMC